MTQTSKKKKTTMKQKVWTTIRMTNKSEPSSA